GTASSPRRATPPVPPLTKGGSAIGASLRGASAIGAATVVDALGCALRLNAALFRLGARQLKRGRVQHLPRHALLRRTSTFGNEIETGRGGRLAKVGHEFHSLK